VETLTLAGIVVIVKSSGAMATLTAWDLVEPYPALRRSLSAHYAALYLADATQRALIEADPHPALYDALVAELGALAPPCVSQVALRYLWTLLGETGYRPDLSGAGPGPIAWFDPGAGRFGPAGAARAWRVRIETVEALRSGAAGESIGEQPAARALRLLDAYLTHLLGRPLPAAAAFFGPGGPGAGAQ
jgi:DNA repair protein RecO (recombination protein O)